MPRLWCWHGGEALLTSRLRAQCSLPLLIHFTWHLQYRPSTSKGLFFRKRGTGDSRAKMTQMPRPEVSEQLLLLAIMLEPFFSPQRQVGGQESQQKGRCH